VRVLIAPDKFKGSLGARSVAENVAAGLRDVAPSVEIDVAPIADGGEGTAESICAARDGKWVTCGAHDALGREIAARYAWLATTETAVLDMSEAAGISRLLPDQRDPLHATTFGVGEMILDAAKRGAREIIIGLGGSATNDGGFGLARALGFGFVDADNERISAPGDLSKLARIAMSEKFRLPKIVAATDVRNPLLGENGATSIFGPQKGAAAGQVKILEAALTRLADVVARELGHDFRDRPGAGAAGGLGFGLMSFCKAEVRSGFDVVADAIQLREKIARADLVITGEGRLDAQTLEGKGPAGVAKLARSLNKRVCAVVGEAADASAEGLFDSVFVLARPPISRTTAIKSSSELLRERGREIAHFYFPSKTAD
jgi:glycerate kinase